jgi:hypothetical protein
MDEDLSFIEDLASNKFYKKSEIHFSDLQAYTKLVESGKNNHFATHADRYDENRSYSTASYVKGCLFLTQLEYLLERKFNENCKRFMLSLNSNILRQTILNELLKRVEQILIGITD